MGGVTASKLQDRAFVARLTLGLAVVLLEEFLAVDVLAPDFFALAFLAADFTPAVDGVAAGFKVAAAAWVT